MITRAGNQRNPYDYFRQKKNNSQISFANLLAKSAAAGATGTQIQRSALVFGAKEEPVDSAEFELPSWMGILGERVYNGATIDECIKVERLKPTYPESIFDIPSDELMFVLSAAMDTVADDVKTEGKTKTEIYDEINAIYESYLGKDFLEPSQLMNMTLTDPLHLQNMGWIPVKYFESMNQKGVDLGKQSVLREVQGYGGMSDEEIREAIRAKYSKSMTLKECLLMSRELDNLGVEKSPGNSPYYLAIMGGIESSLGYFDSAYKKVFNAMLDMPADYEQMKKAYGDHVSNAYNSTLSYNIDDAFEKLLTWIGGDADAYSGIRDMMRDMLQSGELRMNNTGALFFKDFPV